MITVLYQFELFHYCTNLNDCSTLQIAMITVLYQFQESKML